MDTNFTSQKNTAETKLKSNPILAGLITGQLAGLIMAVAVMAVFAILYGRSPLFPVQVIGSTIYGETALHGFHFGALVAGLLLHQLGPSLLWGLAFGLIANRMDLVQTKIALSVGLFIGVVSMVDVFLIVPNVMRALHGSDYWNQEIPLAWDWIAHLIFGSSFALFPYVQKRTLARKL